MTDRHLEDFVALCKNWFWETDAELRFSYFSERYEEVMGLGPEFFLGKSRLEIVRESADSEIWRSHLEDLEARRAFSDFTYRFVNPTTGEVRWIRISGRPFFDPQGAFEGYRGIGEDITAQYLEEQRIREQIVTDALTGLSNRAGLWRAAEEMIADLGGTGHKLILQMIDLDRFKEINDHFGHETGDAVLRSVADRLTAQAERSFCIARLGGDEFALLYHVRDTGQAVAQLSAAWREIGAYALTEADSTIDVRLSSGLAIYPDHAHDFSVLLRYADLALYASKRAGRGYCTLFEQQMREDLEQMLTIKSAFRKALTDHQILPHYQPLLNIKTGKIIGFEALLRWHHPERGVLTPGDFPQVMDDPELLIGIGDYMLEAVCADMQVWNDNNIPFQAVGVNFSSANLRGGDMIALLEDRLDRYGLRPDQLVIELTEDSILLDGNSRFACNISQIRKLVQMGVQIALDDFGTGNASLAHLRTVPAAFVKIDRTFVWQVTDDPRNRAIIEAVIALGQSLGYRCIAEGVENQAQFEILCEMGCNLVQGYHIARPMPAGEVPAFLQSFSAQRLWDQSTALPSAQFGMG